MCRLNHNNNDNNVAHSGFTSAATAVAASVTERCSPLLAIIIYFYKIIANLNGLPFN